MRPEEADAVAALHRSGIPQGFLSELPAGVRRALYRGIERAPRSGVWVAVSETGNVVGFVSGTARVQDCYASLLRRHAAALAWHALPALVSVATWRKVWETLRYPSREVAVSTTAGRGAEPAAELLSIVVDSSARRTGTAGRLTTTFEEALRQWGCRGPYRVVTMASDPRSNAFYIKVGFEFVRPFEHHGVTMNLYHKALTDD